MNDKRQIETAVYARLTEELRRDATENKEVTMTKVLDCTHGGTGCTFSAQGETEEEVVQKLAAHIKNEHDAEITPDLFARLSSAIRDA